MQRAFVLIVMVILTCTMVFAQGMGANILPIYKLNHGRIVQSLDQGKRWEQMNNAPRDVVAIASPPGREGVLIVATKNTLYYGYTQSGSWHVTLQRGHEFTPTQIKFSMQRT